MKHKIENKKRNTYTFLGKMYGFSLVETIIYLAIFTIVSILVINSFITVMSSFATTKTNRNLMEAGINSMERLSREIRQANSIDLDNSNFGLGILQLKSKNNSNNPVIIKFNKENGALNLYQDDSLSGNLIDSSIYLENLIFRRIVTEESEALKIEITLRDTKSKINKTENFYNTIILRGGY